MTEPAHPTESDLHTQKMLEEHVNAVAQRTRKFEEEIAGVRARAQTLRAQYLDRTKGGPVTSTLAPPHEVAAPPATSGFGERSRPIAVPINDLQSSTPDLVALRHALQVARDGIELAEERLQMFPTITSPVEPLKSAPVPPPNPESNGNDEVAANALLGTLDGPQVGQTYDQSLREASSSNPVPAPAPIAGLNGDAVVQTNGHVEFQTKPAPNLRETNSPPAQPVRTARTTVVSRPGQPVGEARMVKAEILPNPSDRLGDKLPDPGNERLDTPAVEHDDPAVAHRGRRMSRIPANLVIQFGAVLVIVALVLIKFG
jgi:hypothetical protein